MQRVVLVVILFLVSFCGWSVNYYCDPVNGNMSNPGTLASPWGSLEAVFNQGITFNGGDRIYLMNGNHGFPKISGVNSTNVEITKYSGQNPIIERIRIGNVAHAAYWLINDVTIQSENVSQFPINLIDLYANTNNITVVNCTISSNLSTTTWTRNDWRTKANNGIFARGTTHTFNNNTIVNTAVGITMSSSNSQFNNNTVQYFSIDGVRGLGNDCSYIGNSILDNISVYYYSENHYDGFQSYSCCPVGGSVVSNVVIKQNTIINCTDNTRQFRGSMQGIGCFDGMYSNWTIENNIVIVDNWHGITLSGATNCKIVNNTIIDPYDVTYQDPNDPQQFGNVGPPYIRISAHKDGTPSTNNIVVNNLVPTLFIAANSATVSNNILLGASSNYGNFFVNYTTYDLHLISTATAIDAGTNTNAPTTDIEGNNRPQGSSTDVGAYEYGSCNTNFSIISPNQTTICLGDAVNLTTNSNTTASWDNGVVDNVSFSPTNTQTYTATVGVGNCTSTQQITITVDSVAAFNTSADRVSVCQGDYITLTTDASSIATWNFGVVDNVAFMPPHPQTYTATVTNGNCSRSEQIAINVSAIPTLTIGSSSTSVCEGTSVVLNATTDGMNLSWDNGVQNNTSFTPLQSKTYTVTANNFGCSVSDSVTITVDTVPVFNIIASQTGICQGDALVLTTDATVTANWDNGVIDNVSFSPSTTLTYSATVNNGSCNHIEQITINVNSLPQISYSVWDSVLCEGESTSLIANSNIGSLTWDNGVQNNVPFTPIQTQIYTASANNNGCIATESIQVIVNPLPIINISQNGSQLQVNNTNGSIQWYLNGNLISGANNSTLVYSTDGDYSVTITDNNGCVGESNIITVIGTSVDSNPFSSMLVYPNPVKDMLYIKRLDGITNIKVVDVSGAVIKEQEHLNSGHIDLSNFSDGIYFVLITTDNKSYFQKIILAK